MARIRVIVADNHPVFREGLCRLLDDEQEIEVVGKAANHEEVVNLAKTLKPDVAIVDIVTPVLAGADATKQVKKISPQTAVLMIGDYNSQTHILAALRAGAAGFLTRETPLRDLASAIRLAYQG